MFKLNLKQANNENSPKELLLEKNKSDTFNHDFVESFQESKKEILQKEKSINSKNDNKPNEKGLGLLKKRRERKKNRRKKRKIEGLMPNFKSKQNPANYSNIKKILIKNKTNFLKNTPNYDPTNNLNKEVNNFNNRIPIEHEISKISTNSQNLRLEAQISNLKNCIEKLEIKISEKKNMWLERFEMFNNRLSEIEKIQNSRIFKDPKKTKESEVQKIWLYKPNTPKNYRNNKRVTNSFMNEDMLSLSEFGFLENLDEIITKYQNEIIDRIGIMNDKMEENWKLSEEIKEGKKINVIKAEKYDIMLQTTNFLEPIRKSYKNRFYELEKNIRKNLMENQEKFWYKEKSFNQRINIIEKENETIKPLINKIIQTLEKNSKGNHQLIKEINILEKNDELNFSKGEDNDEKTNKLQEIFKKNQIEVSPNEIKFLFEVLDANQIQKINHDELKIIHENLLIIGGKDKSDVIGKLLKCLVECD